VPGSYGPADLQSAYNVAADAAARGSGETVAVVDAYDDPDAESDLAVYRSNYGLPACPTADGCFSKVNEDRAASPLPPPAGTTGWDIEESLDLDMVSAICPNCHILLVEANSTSISDLGTAVDSAVSLGAVAVSNSYASDGEFAGETADDIYYDHPGVAVTASAGDSGYQVNFPAVSPYVTAVGGTSLSPDSSVARGWTETVWGDGTEGTDGDGTGSGCSAYEPKPSWQAGVSDPLCGDRTVADVAADADPNTGVAIYDTYNGFGGWQSGWGGTSEASPIIAATYALSDPDTSATVAAGSFPYLHPGLLYNVPAGSTGDCGNYLCQGGPGYNGPTGLGTPDGAGAFTGLPDTITVTSPGTQHSTTGTAVSVQVKASSSAGAVLSYSATGLPGGLSINPASGLITGTPGTVGTFSPVVTVSDNDGTPGTASFAWDVTSSSPPPPPSGYIKATKLPPLVLDDTGGSLANGNRIQVWDQAGAGSSGVAANQKWTIVSKGSYDVIELSRSTSHCLDVAGRGTANGTKVQLWSCNGGVDQEWKPLAGGQLEAVYASSKRGTAVVLDDPSARGNGTKLQIWQSNGLAQQFWTLP
jgi:subtilase family serine protease